MPRRRKRRHSLKASLDFVESPMNVPKSFPSPVLAARNPVTAESKDVAEDDPSVTWVSPQFDYALSTLPRKRRQGGRKGKYDKTTSVMGSYPTRSRNNSGQDNKTSKTVSSKYRPLAFQADTRLEESSESEVGSIDFDLEEDEVCAFPTSDGACIQANHGKKGNQSPTFDMIENFGKFTKLKQLSHREAQSGDDVTPCLDDVTPCLDQQYPTPDQVINPDSEKLCTQCQQHGYNQTPSHSRESASCVQCIKQHHFRKSRGSSLLQFTENHGKHSETFTPRRRSQRLMKREAHRLRYSSLDHTQQNISTLEQEGKITLERTMSMTPNKTIRILAEDTPEHDYGLQNSLRRRRELLKREEWLQLLSSLDHKNQ